MTCVWSGVEVTGELVGTGGGGVESRIGVACRMASGVEMVVVTFGGGLGEGCQVVVRG